MFPTEIQAKSGDGVELMKTRQRTMEELREIGSFPRRFLKKQLTNDRSAPFVSGGDDRILMENNIQYNNNNVTGKVSKPAGGWEDVTGELGLTQCPPNPTNRQTSRLLTGCSPGLPGPRRARGDSLRQTGPELRCGGVGKPRVDPVGQPR